MSPFKKKLFLHKRDCFQTFFLERRVAMPLEQVGEVRGDVPAYQGITQKQRRKKRTQDQICLQDSD
jgi:hypothetical protein